MIDNIIDEIGEDLHQQDQGPHPHDPIQPMTWRVKMPNVRACQIVVPYQTACRDMKYVFEVWPSGNVLNINELYTGAYLRIDTNQSPPTVHVTNGAILPFSVQSRLIDMLEEWL